MVYISTHFYRAHSFFMTCGSVPSCTTRLRHVQQQRYRLEVVIWQRSFDNMLATFNAPVSECSHANAFYFLIHWVNATFFYELVNTPNRVNEECTCPPLCHANYKERTRRFVSSFVSYATPIRILQQEHIQALQSIATCCNSPFDSNLMLCISDFSMQLFMAVNSLFCNSMLRARNINIPHHITKVVKDTKHARVNTTYYDAWRTKQLIHLKQVLTSFPCASAKKGESKEGVERVEEVQVEFLDETMK